MTACSRGQVILVLYPNSDLLTAKKRPALVVQADDLGTGLRQVVVALLTSNLSRAGHPSRVLLRADTPQGREAGTLSDTVVVTDNLATVRLEIVDRTIGSILDMTAIDLALAHTLGLG